MSRGSVDIEKFNGRNNFVLKTMRTLSTTQSLAKALNVKDKLLEVRVHGEGEKQKHSLAEFFE